MHLGHYNSMQNQIIKQYHIPRFCYLILALPIYLCTSRIAVGQTTAPLISQAAADKPFLRSTAGVTIAGK